MSLAHAIDPRDTELADLREENAFLRRQLILELDEVLFGRLQATLRLTPSMTIIVAALYRAAGRPVSAGRICDLLPRKDGADRNSDNIVNVQICKLRGRLGRDSITNVWGRGYLLGAEMRGLCEATERLCLARDANSPVEVA